VPPVSLVLATWAGDHIAGLTAFRHLHAPDDPARSIATHEWLQTFASATTRSSRDAETYAARIDEITLAWRAALGRVRAHSAVDLLIAVLPGAPVVTVESAAALLGRSTVRTGEAINRLVEAGVLLQRNTGRQRYRVFEAAGVVEVFTSLERALASPTGDTADEPPRRPVPRGMHSR
jgi:hypothetical protein